MSLVNLVRSVTFSVVLGVGSIYALGCDASSGSAGAQYCGSDNDCKGDRICVNGKCQGGRDGNGSDSLCQELCDKVWYDCDGLPGANYWLGTSHSDCISRCPTFLESVAQSQHANQMTQSIKCVATGGKSCESLEKDSCAMDEGDLFAKYNY